MPQLPYRSVEAAPRGALEQKMSPCWFFGAIARTTRSFAILVDFDATARSRADDFSFAIPHALGVWLRTHDTTIVHSRAAFIGGFDGQCRAKSKCEKSRNESCDVQLQSSKCKQPSIVIGSITGTDLMTSSAGSTVDWVIKTKV
jgi:hypothetical protein